MGLFNKNAGNMGRYSANKMDYSGLANTQILHIWTNTVKILLCEMPWFKPSE